MNLAKQIREYKMSNPEATPSQIADACKTNLQYVHTTLNKAKTRAKMAEQIVQTQLPSAEQRQVMKGQQVLRDEINRLHAEVTRLKLHNDMLQAMLKVQEFDLMNRRNGSSI